MAGPASGTLGRSPPPLERLHQGRHPRDQRQPTGDQLHPVALILPAIPALEERGRTAGALLSSPAASGVVTRPPSGSSKRPPYSESAPHGNEDLFDIARIPRPETTQNQARDGLFFCPNGN